MKTCHNCDDCVYIGEGDFICDKCNPFIVMEDFVPNEYYMACKNKQVWKEAQELNDDEE